MKKKSKNNRVHEQGQTIESLMRLMKRRGLTINDENNAIHCLEEIGYYRLSGYATNQNNEYDEIKDFDHLIKVYEFDTKLRSILFDILAEVEISFRAHIIQFLSQKYGSLGYRNSNIFINAKEHKIFLDSIDRDIKTNKDLAVEGIEIREKNYPIWMIADVFTFGELIRIYINLNKTDRVTIAKKYKIPEIYMESWLRHLSNIRNICAHHGKIYGHKFTTKPLLSSQIKRFSKSEDSFFISLLIMKNYCINKNHWKIYVASIMNLINQYKTYINLNKIGYESYWNEILIG